MIAPDWHPTQRQLRQFAAAALPAFALFAWMLWKATASATGAAVLLVIGAAIFAVGLLAPRWVRPAYWFAVAVTLPIGWLISGLLLRLIYTLVFGSFGFALRALGHDPLLLKKPELRSHWVRRPQRRDASSYYRQA